MGDQILAVRGAELAASVTGEGPPTFVWGHGLSSSRADEDALRLSDWGPVADASRLVRYDARGHGESSSAGDPAELRWSELGLDMLGVADAIGAATFVAGGASMGCATALHAAVAAPERVAGLVLQIPPTAWATRAAQADMYSAGVSFLRAEPERGLELIVAGLGSTPPLGSVISAEYPEAVAIMQERMGAQDPKRLADAFAGAAASDFPDEAVVASVEAAALIIAWAGDPGHPVETADRLHALLPGSELHVATTLDAVRGWPEQIARFLRALGARIS